MASALPQAPFNYMQAMEFLLEVVQDLSMVRDLQRLMEIVRRAARTLTGADGATFVLREGDQCYYADEDAIQPLWKGSRFPMRTCISGWVMMNRAALPSGERKSFRPRWKSALSKASGGR